MNTNYDNMSLFDIAYKITEESKDGYTINELLKLTLEAKGMDTTDNELITNLYIEICSSSKFVYLENKKWDLKTRHSLDEYDKDGSKFVDKAKLEELNDNKNELDEEDLDEEDLDDEDSDDETDDEDDTEETNDEHYHSKEDNYDDSDDFGEDYSNDDSFDEEKYNSTMDDYEDEYDK